MKHYLSPRTVCSLLFACAMFPLSVVAAESTFTAKDLAAKLSTLQQDGSSYIRLRLEVQQPPGTKTTALQIQIRQLRTKASTNVIYQILWPKERQGEGILLTTSGGGSPKGTRFVPPTTTESLGSSSMKDSLFESDLAYADIIENFYAWGSQSIVGEEMIGRVNCLILESKPTGGQRSIYTKVRSWVDPDRLVPLLVEKFGPGGSVRRIETTRVSKEDNGQHIPAGLSVQRPGRNSVTTLEGSRLDTRMNFGAEDFTVEALKEIKKP